MLGVIIGLLIVYAAMLLVPSDSGAHTPRPIACDIARDQAPPGQKWRAQQVCIAAQRKHVADHVAAVRIATVTRACLRTGYRVLGVGMCRAIATVKPAWATSWYYHELLDRESSGSTNAVNERSGACGSFQRLPCPWHYYGGTSAPGDDRTYSSALQQTRNGVHYIEDRYGDPAGAITFHNANGYY